MADLSVSGTNDPYHTGSYSAPPNEKNTLTITSYFKLLAAQLQNQDMTNPMDNSEMMAQMTQMAMVQSMTAMTEAVETSSAINTSTYASGLMGKEITVAVLDDNNKVKEFKTGVVTSVDLTNGSPRYKLEGDDKYYSLSQLVGMGKIEMPEEEGEEPGDEETPPVTEPGGGETPPVTEPGGGETPPETEPGGNPASVSNPPLLNNGFA